MFTKNKTTISVLIPCYNWSIYDLVHDLHKLCSKSLKIHKFEIICIEDNSTFFFKNAEISKLQYVTHETLSKNIGRSKIRNLLAKRANYEWLLFIDADQKIVNDKFIEIYINKILNQNVCESTQKTLYYGSTIYPLKTVEKNTELHWKYGSNVEAKRKKHVFSSHHFLISKHYFSEKKVSFNENITSYGYEDVFFVLDNNLKTIYVNNPLLHIGIKKTAKFIKQTESALRNLSKQHKLTANPEKTIRILYFQKKISDMKLTNLILNIFNISKEMILKNLHSKHPSIWLFQFYKLGFLLQLKNTQILIKKRQ